MKGNTMKPTNTIKMVAIGTSKEGKTVYMSESLMKRLQMEAKVVDKPTSKI